MIETRFLTAGTALPAPVIIGFSGKAGAGKSTAARHLKEAHGFTRIRFADPLKHMLITLLEGQGAGFATAVRMVDGDLKEVPTPYLCGQTPRHAMQTLGTEWGRDRIAPDFWISAWGNAVQRCIAFATTHPALIVVDDVRFPNEVAAIKRFGGKVICIDRPGLAAVAADHISEQHELPSDDVIRNDGTENDLHARIGGLLMA